MHIKYLCLIPILMFLGCFSNNHLVEERTYSGKALNPTGRYTETYHFYRDGNKEVKHGIYLYKRETDDGKFLISQTGVYIDGLKQGLWTVEHEYPINYHFFSDDKVISTDIYNRSHEKITSCRHVYIKGNPHDDEQMIRSEGTYWVMNVDGKGAGKQGKIYTYVKDKPVKTDDCDENGYIIAEDSGIIVKDNLAYRKGDDIPFSGVIVTYHDNSSFSSKKHFKKGIFTGKLEYFNPDGSLKSVTPEKSAEVKGNAPSQ